MDAAELIPVLVFIGPDARDAESLGKHGFLSVPHVGDVVIIHDPQHYALKVVGVTHFPHALETAPGRPQPLVDATVQIIGMPV